MARQAADGRAALLVRGHGGRSHPCHRRRHSARARALPHTAIWIPTRLGSQYRRRRPRCKCPFRLVDRPWRPRFKGAALRERPPCSSTVRAGRGDRLTVCPFAIGFVDGPQSLSSSFVGEGHNLAGHRGRRGLERTCGSHRLAARPPRAPSLAHCRGGVRVRRSRSFRLRQ